MSDQFIGFGAGDSTMSTSSVLGFFYQCFSISFPAYVAGQDGGYGGGQPRIKEKHYVGDDTIIINGGVFAERLDPHMIARETERDALINLDYVANSGKPRRFHILVIQAGTNLGTGVAATDAAALKSYCQRAKTAGWDGTIVCPAWDKRSYSAYMQAYNAILATYTAADGVDRVLPHDDVRLYATNACESLTYFVESAPGSGVTDGIHPNVAGHAIKAGHLATAWASLKAELSAS